MLEDEVWIGFQIPTSSSIACFIPTHIGILLLISSRIGG